MTNRDVADDNELRQALAHVLWIGERQMPSTKAKATFPDVTLFGKVSSAAGVAVGVP